MRHRARRLMAPVAASILALLQLPQAAAGQEQDRWAFAVDLGFNGSSGNSSFAILNTGFRVSHLQQEVAEFEWSVDYRYGESEGLVIARNVRTNIKADLYPQDTWSPFVFATVQHDPIRRLDLRSNSGAGAKYTFWDGETGKASLSFAAIHSYEEFSQELFATPIERTARQSWRFKGEKALGSKVRVEHITFYQPVWDQLDDYYVDLTSTVSVQVSSDINLLVRHEYLHDESPPQGVLRDDNNLSVGLRFSF